MDTENNTAADAPTNFFAQRLLALLAQPNGDVAKALREADPALSRDQLTFLRIAEEGDKNRKGALEAIDAAGNRLDQEEAKAAAEAERHAIAAREANLVRFGLKAPKDGDPVAAARTGKSFLVLGDGDKEIAGLNRIEADPSHFTTAGGRVMYGRRIAIAGVDLKVVLRSVALIDEDGTVHGVCEIPGGVDVGGRNIELPGGSLVFG